MPFAELPKSKFAPYIGGDGEDKRHDGAWGAFNIGVGEPYSF